MTVAIPAFPGTLMAVGVENKTIPVDQLQENGIALDTKRGVKLHISRRGLKSRVSSNPEITGIGVMTTPWCLLRTRAQWLWPWLTPCQVNHVPCGWLRVVLIKMNVNWFYYGWALPKGNLFHEVSWQKQLELKTLLLEWVGISPTWSNANWLISWVWRAPGPQGKWNSSNTCMC